MHQIPIEHPAHRVTENQGALNRGAAPRSPYSALNWIANFIWGIADDVLLGEIIGGALE